ncbi:helix-turn-helix domain-containing protein [Streptomyces himalayensis]|uniref:Helix-turn-helix transcriptional regulator n=1 Tax=Streptomyces himalayensis subsp. himalayensis TaxID=2756131 RepID=A0A7W0ID24_9ACTN|nr:helix-turn-helix transcriptional regulator [Streptomyces himalayensis subsp. himalayensis]
MFAAKGYDDTTLAEVAAAAGVSKRTLFNYFRNKEDLALNGLSEQGNRSPRGSPSAWPTRTRGCRCVAGRPRP